jgi:hypothetical protein
MIDDDVAFQLACVPESQLAVGALIYVHTAILDSGLRLRQAPGAAMAR